LNEHQRCVQAEVHANYKPKYPFATALIGEARQQEQCGRPAQEKRRSNNASLPSCFASQVKALLEVVQGGIRGRVGFPRGDSGVSITDVVFSTNIGG